MGTKYKRFPGLGQELKIANQLGLPLDNIFLQAVDMSSGGEIGVHYDSSLSGFINYKCNISVLCDDYQFHIDKHCLEISEGDMYCFEASLYRHWTEKFSSRRVFLSFGFVVPYNVLGRDENDPRVRLSKRIEKYFQQVFVMNHHQIHHLRKTNHNYKHRVLIF